MSFAVMYQVGSSFSGTNVFFFFSPLLVHLMLRAGMPLLALSKLSVITNTDILEKRLKLQFPHTVTAHLSGVMGVTYQPDQMNFVNGLNFFQHMEIALNSAVILLLVCAVGHSLVVCLTLYLLHVLDYQFYTSMSVQAQTALSSIDFTGLWLSVTWVHVLMALYGYELRLIAYFNKAQASLTADRDLMEFAEGAAQCVAGTWKNVRTWASFLFTCLLVVFWLVTPVEVFIVYPISSEDRPVWLTIILLFNLSDLAMSCSAGTVVPYFLVLEVATLITAAVLKLPDKITCGHAYGLLFFHILLQRILWLHLRELVAFIHCDGMARFCWKDKIQVFHILAIIALFLVWMHSITESISYRHYY